MPVSVTAERVTFPPATFCTTNLAPLFSSVSTTDLTRLRGRANCHTIPAIFRCSGCFQLVGAGSVPAAVIASLAKVSRKASARFGLGLLVRFMVIFFGSTRILPLLVYSNVGRLSSLANSSSPAREQSFFSKNSFPFHHNSLRRF